MIADLEVEVEEDEKRFAAFLDRHIYGCKDFYEYLEKKGGIQRMMELRKMDMVMEICQNGLVDYTFLGGAQIDRYGNLNSTIIGRG